jgi:hypothetical protein
MYVYVRSQVDLLESQPRHSTELNQRNSPLLRLPAELRNQIYMFAFCNITVDVRSRYENDPIDNQNLIQGHRRVVGLLTTCRQLHHEALPIFYEYCTFDIFYPSALIVWMRNQHNGLRALKKCWRIKLPGYTVS